MLEHYEESVRSQGDDLRWQLRIRSYTHLSKRDQKGVTKDLERMQKFRFVVDRKPSVYEQADPAERVLMIGSCLAVSGAQWLAEHPRQADWLREQRITPDEAIRRHKDWLRATYRKRGWDDGKLDGNAGDRPKQQRRRHDHAQRSTQRPSHR